jgi:radical SAM superfamily enzyme YgiQ (UPF0313 family)
MTEVIANTLRTQKEKLDCLLIHTPKSLGQEGGYAMIMAMGLLAMADWLEQNGYSALILNLGVEKIVDADFSIEHFLEHHDVGVIGISLHWHFQSLDVINLSKAIKAVRPEIPIVLGGYTASFFAGEILRNYASIDFVVCGDGEVPLLNLLNQLGVSTPDFSQVPNLVWRCRGDIVRNQLTYVAGPDDMAQLNFSNFELIKHFSTYTRIFLFMPYYSNDLLNDSKTFFLCVGRGCPVSCSFCGGGRPAQKIIFGRQGFVFRPIERVLETVRDAVEAGIKMVYVCFDPDPVKEYYLELFKAIRQKKINVAMTFECWSLPDTEFLRAFVSTFGNHRESKIVLSPDSGAERQRKQHRGFFYTNKNLLAVLRQLRSDNIFTEVYFTYPLPGDTLNDIEETDRFICTVEQEIGERGHVIIQDFGYDPGSPLYLHPESFNLQASVPTFANYCRRHDEDQLIPTSSSGDMEIYGHWIQRSKAAVAMSRAKALSRINRHEEAANYVREALKSIPGDWDALMLLGSCLEQLGKPERARLVYREAMRLYPSIVV